VIGRGSCKYFGSAAIICAGVCERGLPRALAGVGGVDDLLLRVERGGEAQLFVARGEPRVDGQRGDENCGAEGDEFDCAACHASPVMGFDRARLGHAWASS